MHILFFNRSFYPDTAATGQLLAELCESLVRDYGLRISVVAGTPLNPVTDTGYGTQRVLHRIESHAGIDIYRAFGTRFSKQRFIGRFSNYVSYFLSACWTGLRVSRPDVVVSLTDPPIIGLAGLLTARRHRIPFAMSYRDIFPEVARLLEDFQSPMVERVLQWVNCFLIRHADRIVTLGDTMSRRLIDGKGADPRKVVVIPDWADCSEITPAPKQNPFTEAHDFQDKFVVMHSGNLGLSQSLETIIDAAALLQQYPEIIVVFVGEGVKKKPLLEKVNSLGLTNVLFLPYTPKEKLTESFAAADVFIISLKQGMAGYIVPSKLYGILAAGRPYIAAVEEESEVVDITRRFHCGLTAPPGDAGSLAARVLELYHDRNAVHQMGENARIAGLEFDRKRGVEKYYRLFQDLLVSSAATSLTCPLS